MYFNPNEQSPGDENIIDDQPNFSSPPLNLDRGKEMLTITVEIGNGQRENIIIFENDTAERVAEDFCQQYVNINSELK